MVAAYKSAYLKGVDEIGNKLDYKIFSLRKTHKKLKNKNHVQNVYVKQKAFSVAVEILLMCKLQKLFIRGPGAFQRFMYSGCVDSHLSRTI